MLGLRGRGQNVVLSRNNSRAFLPGATGQAVGARRCCRRQRRLLARREPIRPVDQVLRLQCGWQIGKRTLSGDELVTKRPVSVRDRCELRPVLRLIQQDHTFTRRGIGLLLRNIHRPQEGDGQEHFCFESVSDNPADPFIQQFLQGHGGHTSGHCRHARRILRGGRSVAGWIEPYLLQSGREGD